MTPRPKAPRPAGIALVLALVVVLLLTAYMSEFFFSTGLELRSMRTFKDAAKARGMARLVFKATQAGLVLDEMEFFANYRNMEKVLTHSAIPWQDGLLVELKIIPQDGLFNLNELSATPGSSRDRVRWNLFRNILSEVEVQSNTADLPPQPLTEGEISEIYAALVDWIDRNEISYQGIALSVGAEQAEYLSREPEVAVKNGRLDRLSEIRLVRGVVKSHLPWFEWQQRFSVLPKSKKSEPYPEKLNINVASREEIQAFLEQREMDDMTGLGTDQVVQANVNNYAGRAAEIAEQLGPENPLESREPIDSKILNTKIKALQLNTATAKQLFSFHNEYYRIRITTSFNDVDALLEALVNIPRSNNRIGTVARVLHMTLD